MSDLDGNASSAPLKPKLVVQSKNIVESSKKDAQNYFKSLSSSVKKPTSVLSKEVPSFKEEKVVIYLSTHCEQLLKDFAEINYVVKCLIFLNIWSYRFKMVIRMMIMLLYQSQILCQ